MLDNLPPPPSDKTGWPWTEGSPALPPTMADGSPWPRISIVTPSYNQAQFLEETIRSVLLQGYPNLEYFVVDGGSTDGTVEIIRKYEPWITWWVSERDQGQSHALNKGFRRATGAYVAWLNSDDSYAAGALVQLVPAIHAQPHAVLVYGDCNIVEPQGNSAFTWQSKQTDLRSLLLDGNTIPQQTALMRRTMLEAVGGVDESLHYVMDYALWMKLAQQGSLCRIPAILANFRMHDASKSMAQGDRFFDELFAWWERTGLLAEALDAAEREEVLRRRRTDAALEAWGAGNDGRAIHCLRDAAADGQWPFGSAAALANRLYAHPTLAGKRLEGSSWQEYLRMRRLLTEALPPQKAAEVWRLVELNYHLSHLYTTATPTSRRAVRYHLRRAMALQPRLLLNRGMWALGARSFLGTHQ